MKGRGKTQPHQFEYGKYDDSDSSYEEDEIRTTCRKKNTQLATNRFDLFDPPRKKEQDPFLKSISRRITLLSLRVSHIENRLADYETREEVETQDNYLKEPLFS